MTVIKYPPTTTDLSGYVPYTGATTDVNLNVQILHVDTVRAFSEEGILFQSRGIRDIAKFEYGTVAQKLWSPTDYLMEFNATSYDLQTNYVINANELASAAIAASIGSWGRGGTYFQIKYNNGDSDWGKPLYMDSSGYIHNPDYLFTANADFNFNSPAGYTNFGDIAGINTGVTMYIETFSGQIAFGNISTGDNFYWDAIGGSIFAYGGINTYTLSSTSLSIVNDARINLLATYSTANNGDLWHDSAQKQITAYTDGVTQCLVGTLFTQTADATVASTTTATSIIGTGIGTLNLPANFEVSGKTVEWKIGGKKSATVTPVNITIEVLLGTTVIGTTAAVVSAAGTNYGWEASGLITCRTTGGSGVIKCSGRYTELIATGANVGIIDSAATINTAASQVLSVKVTWSTSSATNTITSHNSVFLIEN